MDRQRRLGGRGAYICPNAGCLGKIMEGRFRARAFGTRVGEAAWQELFDVLQKESWPDHMDKD